MVRFCVGCDGGLRLGSGDLRGRTLRNIFLFLRGDRFLLGNKFGQRRAQFRHGHDLGWNRLVPFFFLSLFLMFFFQRLQLLRILRLRRRVILGCGYRFGVRFDRLSFDYGYFGWSFLPRFDDGI